jgi:Metallo-beta-lactamase superfamily.
MAWAIWRWPWKCAAPRWARSGPCSITHPHIDHYGMARLLVDKTGAEVWMHPAGNLDFLAFADPEGERARLRRVLTDHGVEPATSRRCPTS